MDALSQLMVVFEDFYKFLTEIINRFLAFFGREPTD